MYQALYRKYRPKDFDSVVGQDSIIKTLRNSIAHNTFSHAYMFFGPRGTGKTTVSKIFARNINCLNSNNGIACQNCDNCKYSFSKECVDIIEIDAASNNGVDEIRELKNKISLVPTQLKYKVYIIDEVHMLSIGAFNALLKTLEEPPEHAIFILATTDPQKVPETIISRCQCFSFKKISSSVISNRLRYICDVENILIDDDVLNSIALLSDGGLRDALGLLDKLTSYCDEGKQIIMDDFIEINGIVSKSDLNDLFNYIFNSDITGVLKSIHKFDADGKNILQILIQLLDYLRNLVVDYYLSNVSIHYSIDYVIDFTNYLNENMFDIKKSDNVLIYIEMVLLKYINKTNKTSLSSNGCSKSNNLENDIPKDDSALHLKDSLLSKSIDESSIDVNNSDKFDNNNNNNNNNDIVNNNNSFSSNKYTEHISPKILNLEDIISVRINNTLAMADKNLLQIERKKFDLLKDFTFDPEIGFIVCNILDSTLRVVSSDSFIISFEYESTVKQNLSILDRIMDVYNEITNSNKKIAIVSDSKWNELKNDYINHLKNNLKYDILEEPKVILEDLKKDDIITSSAIDLFGDIVEIE